MNFSYYLEYYGKKEITKNGKIYYQVSFKDDNIYYNFLCSDEHFKNLDNYNSGDTFLCNLLLKRRPDFSYSLSLLDFEAQEV